MGAVAPTAPTLTRTLNAKFSMTKNRKIVSVTSKVQASKDNNNKSISPFTLSLATPSDLCVRPLSLSGFQLGNSNVVNTILHDGPVHESASSVSYNNPIVFEVNVSVKQLYANPTSFSVAW